MINLEIPKSPIRKDILERISDLMQGNEHPELMDTDILSLLNSAAHEIRALRMVNSNYNFGTALGSSAVDNDIILSALNGSATTVATRHDCPPDKMVRAAISIAKELKSQMG